MKTEQQPLIEVVEDRCVNCHRCISVCPVKMCNNGSGDHVEVNHELCIGCGQCIDACTHDARRGLDDSDSFFDDLEKGTPIAAVVAPAVAAQFPGQHLHLNGWLTSLGVAAFFDVSFGAELTVKSYLHYIQTASPKMVIAQPCPTLVTFIEVYRPQLLPLLAPADSPMAHTMKMIRTYYPEFKDHRLAVISPCLSKRREFNDIGIGDYNVTMKALASHIEAKKINLLRYPQKEYDNPPAERAVLFSSPGGLMRTVERYLPDASEITRKIEGQPGIYHYLAHMPEALKNELASLPVLVDCLNCEMGCNGGPGTDNRNTHPDVLEGAVERRALEMRKKYAPKGEPSSRLGKKRRLKKIEKLLEERWSPQLYRRSYKDRSGNLRTSIREPGKTEIEEIYQSTHKYKPEDFLNCGSCGYKSCEQMAFAIANGLNRPENCRQFVETDLQHHVRDREEVSAQLKHVAEESAEHLQQNIQETRKLNERAQQMSAAVTESSSAIEEMVAQIHSVSKVLQKNAESVNQLMQSSEEGRSVLDNVASTIREIAANSKGLGEASEVIQSIAGQTNLLSMNASIEAAHAGEAGRGFSVVADEIRKLSEGSAEQARSISQVLEGIKNSIETVKTSSADTLQRFETVAELTTTVRDQEMTIKDAVEEQSTGGNQVVEALQEINELTSTVESTARSILESSEAVLTQVKKLSDI